MPDKEFILHRGLHSEAETGRLAASGSVANMLHLMTGCRKELQAEHMCGHLQEGEAHPILRLNL
jgi:hypothetical protein